MNSRHAKRTRRRAVPIVAATFAVVLALGTGALVAWPVINDVETGQTPEYPSLQPATYPVSELRALTAVQEAIDGLPGWTLDTQTYAATLRDAPATEVRATAIAWGPLPDSEVRVRLAPHGEGGTIASIRSHSPNSRGDLGQNARNIRTLLGAIDSALLR